MALSKGILNVLKQDMTLTGGNERDLLTGRLGNDTIYGGGGDDDIRGLSGADKLYGGEGEDQLYGGAGIDRLFGGSGSDILEGGAGSDWLYGGEGNDYASYTESRGAVTINLSTGVNSGGDAQGDRYESIESLVGSRHKDRLTGNDGANDLNGYHGNDFIWGGAGDDFVDGHHGNDTLFGGSGNDQLLGGMHNDVMTGGEGNDIFLFGSDERGRDIIKDFTNGADKLHFLDLGHGHVLKSVQSGNNVVITWGKQVIVLENFRLTDFDASDYAIMN